MNHKNPQKPPKLINFSNQKGKEIIANFDGGIITSDAGIVWIAEFDKKLEITGKFANCFQDHRHQSYVDHSVHQLLAQRLYGIILGYEDVNDHCLLYTSDAADDP